MSWYNFPRKENGLGEDVFVNELIPHIDKSYRTIAGHKGRAIEGFSREAAAPLEYFLSIRNCGVQQPRVARVTVLRNASRKMRDGRVIHFVFFLLVTTHGTWQKNKRRTRRSRRHRFFYGSVRRGFNYEDNLKYSKHLNLSASPTRCSQFRG